MKREPPHPSVRVDAPQTPHAQARQHHDPPRTLPLSRRPPPNVRGPAAERTGRAPRTRSTTRADRAEDRSQAPSQTFIVLSNSASDMHALTDEQPQAPS